MSSGHGPLMGRAYTPLRTGVGAAIYPIVSVSLRGASGKARLAASVTDLLRSDHRVQSVAVGVGVFLRSHEDEISQIPIRQLPRYDGHALVHAGGRIRSTEGGSQRRRARHLQVLRASTDLVKIWTALLDRADQIPRRRLQGHLSAACLDRVVAIDDRTVDHLGISVDLRETARRSNRHARRARF